MLTGDDMIDLDEANMNALQGADATPSGFPASSEMSLLKTSMLTDAGFGQDENAFELQILVEL